MKEFKTDISSIAKYLVFKPSIHPNAHYNIEITKDAIPDSRVKVSEIYRMSCGAENMYDGCQHTQ